MSLDKNGMLKFLFSFLAVIVMMAVIPLNVAFAADDEDDEKEAEKDEEYEESDAEKAYAQYLYDAVDKNAGIKYYTDDDDMSSGLSVEDIVVKAMAESEGNLNPVEDSGQSTGREYAVFLETMHEWNLYVTYRSVMDVGMSIFGTIAKIFIGGITIIGLYMGNMLDAFMGFIVKMFEFFNIFSYMGTNTENGFKIDSESGFVFLQPIVNVFNGIGAIAKIAIGLVIVWLIFMTISGIGKAKNRGGYFWSGFGKVFTMLFAIVGLPIMLSFLLQTFADELDSTSEDGMFGKLVSPIPASYIVDSQAWIDGSMKIAAENKSLLATGGQVLYKPSWSGLSDEDGNSANGYPIKPAQVRDTVPSKELVKALNDPAYTTGIVDEKRDDTKNDDIKDATSLVSNWMSMSGMTASSIDGMYGMTSEEKGKWYNGDTGEKRIAQFGLSPQAGYVQVSDGSGFLSTDYEEVTIQRAAMAGNGLLSIALNAVEMMSQIWGIVIVSYIMMFSILSAIFRSIVLFATNIAISALGSVAGLVGVIMTFTMLVTTTLTAILTVGIYAQIVTEFPAYMMDAIGNALPGSMGGGVGGQFVTVLAVFIVNVGGIFLAVKTRRSVITAIEEFFKRILIRLSLATHGDGSRTAGTEALNNMTDNARDGWSAPERGGALGGALGDEAKAIAGDNEDALSSGQAAYDNALEENPGDYEGARDARRNAEKDSVEQTRANKGSMAGRMKEAGLAGSSAILGDIAENSPNKGDGDKRAATDASGFLAEKANDGLMKRQGLNSTGDMSANLDDQDGHVSDLEAAQGDYDDAQQNVADLKAERARMEADGASDAELAEMDEKIDSAEKDAALKGKRVRDSADALTTMGGMQDEINDSERQSLDALNEAGQAHSDADNAITDLESQKAALQEQRDEAEANGASAEELQAIDDQIEDVDGQIAEQEALKRQAQRDMGNAEANLENGVVDANNMQNYAQDKDAADEAVHRAQQEYEDAQTHGDLSDADNAALQKEVSKNAGVVDSIEADRGQQFQDAQAEKDAYDYLADNDGKVFNENDVENAQQAYDDASKDYSSEKASLEEMEGDRAAVNEQAGAVSDAEKALESKEASLANMQASGASTEDIQNAENDVQSAQESLAGEQGKLDTLKANAPSSDDIKAQSAKVDEAMVAQSEANSTLSAVENIEQGNMGSLSEEAVKQESNIKQAQDTMTGAYAELDTAQKGMADITDRVAAGESVSDKEMGDAIRYVRAAESGLEKATGNYDSIVSERDAGIEQSKVELADASSVVGSAQTKVNQLKANNAPSEEITNAETQLAEAQSTHAQKESTVRAQQSISGGTQAEMMDARQSLDSANGSLSQLYKQQAAGDSSVTPERIHQAQQEVDDAKSGFNRAANMHTANVDSHMRGGAVTSTMVNRQKSKVESLVEQEKSASSKLDNLEAMKAGGDNIPDSQIEQAQQNVKAAKDNVSSAQRVYDGMNAQKVTGGKMDSAKHAAVNQNYQTAKSGLNNIKGIKGDLSSAMSSGKMSKGHMVQLMKSNSLMAQRASDKTARLGTDLKRAQSSLSRKQQIQSAGGKVSSREISRDRERVKTLTEEVNQSRREESQISNQAGMVKDKAKTMNSNIEARKANVNAAQSKFGDMQKQYDSAMTMRGIDENTVQNVRNNLEDDKQSFRESPSRFREHHQKATERLTRDRVAIEERRDQAKRMANMSSVGRTRSYNRDSSGGSDW